MIPLFILVVLYKAGQPQFGAASSNILLLFAASWSPLKEAFNKESPTIKTFLLFVIFKSFSHNKSLYPEVGYEHRTPSSHSAWRSSLSYPIILLKFIANPRDEKIRIEIKESLKIWFLENFDLSRKGFSINFQLNQASKKEIKQNISKTKLETIDGLGGITAEKLILGRKPFIEFSSNIGYVIPIQTKSKNLNGFQLFQKKLIL